MGKKGEEVKEKEEKSCTREGRMEEKEREKEREQKKSQVPVSCLLQGSQRHEAKGTPLARKEQRR